MILDCLPILQIELFKDEKVKASMHMGYCYSKDSVFFLLFMASLQWFSLMESHTHAPTHTAYC